MGIRLTSISTPLGGIGWEYDEKKVVSLDSNDYSSVEPRQKLKVFISSKCGVEKYDNVRHELKGKIEDTKLANVYLFEEAGAGSLKAKEHYLLELQQSDVCIFLIDNADGVPDGVKREIETAQKCKIKSFFYFCSEKATEKTELERSMMGADFAKSYTVRNFSDLVNQGSIDLISEIVNIYRYYCAHQLNMVDESAEINNVSQLKQDQPEKPMIPKDLLKKTHRSRDYILQFILGSAPKWSNDEVDLTGDIDDWCLSFLKIMLTGNSIRDFNIGLFLDSINEHQSNSFSHTVNIRWKAVQTYYLDNIEASISYLKQALADAKEKMHPKWFINDILIDLRNLHNLHNSVTNSFSESSAQVELNNTQQIVHYPVIDRINNNVREKYIAGLLRQETESPYSITINNELTDCAEMIANNTILAMSNGSLTQLLQIYDRIKEFAFYLSHTQDIWIYKLCMFKLALYSGDKKETDRMIDSYPEILNHLDSSNAEQIMSFCSTNPISYKRMISQLIGFGRVGYYLSDEQFSFWNKKIFDSIKEWLDSENAAVNIGYTIFPALTNVAYRLDANKLAELCCAIIDRHYVRYYHSMFDMIDHGIDIRNMSCEQAMVFIDHIIMILQSDDERTLLSYRPSFLEKMRNQDREITNALDEHIQKYLPEYYESIYKYNTTVNEEQDYPASIAESIDNIKKRIQVQGKDGVYHGYAINDLRTIRVSVQYSDVHFSDTLIDSAINSCAEVLIHSKDLISYKLEAIKLMICIMIKHPGAFIRNEAVFHNVIESANMIEESIHNTMLSNIDGIALTFGLLFLSALMGNDTYAEILETFTFIRDDTATTIAVVDLLLSFVETGYSDNTPVFIDSFIILNIAQWIQAPNLDIRHKATRILLRVGKQHNVRIMNRLLVSLINTDNYYIKNLILRNLFSAEGITNETQQYIISKCKDDVNYVVRRVCEDEMAKHKLC